MNAPSPQQSLARAERAALCDTALTVGPGAPTLDEGWTVKDLLVHLILRESSVAAIGVVVKPLAPVAAKASQRIGSVPFPDLVERLRNGPPVYSPFRIGALDTLANTMEFFIHHEDIRRAQPVWEPRAMSAAEQAALWGSLKVLGKGLVRRAPVGVVAKDAGTGSRATLRKGESSVVVSGLPGEVALFLFGRRDQAKVDLEGAPADVASMRTASLGI